MEQLEVEIMGRKDVSQDIGLGHILRDECEALKKEWSGIDVGITGEVGLVILPAGRQLMLVPAEDETGRSLGLSYGGKELTDEESSRMKETFRYLGYNTTEEREFFPRRTK